MENGYFHRRSMSAERPLPSPTDTPYETPRVSSPRISSFGTTTPSTPLTNSTTSMQNAHKRRSQHGSGSQYDPEQFTPTIHASLVSEILSLRREMDSKRDFIEDLEANLSSARAENDALQSSLRRQGKESRALKRELQLHEDGTLSAMEALAKERDDMKEANAELRRRFDTSQKRLRSQEEDALRFKATLEQERSSGASSKRSLERRAEVAEERLRAVVEEVTASQAASLENSHMEEAEACPVEEPTFGSPESTRSTRHKRNDTLGSLREAKPSLADELNFSDSNYDQSDNESVQEPHRPRTPPNRVSAPTTQDSPARMRSPQTRDRILARAEERRSKVLGMVSAFEQQMKREDRESKRSSIASRTLSQSSNKLRFSIPSSMDLFADASHLPSSQHGGLSSSSAIDDDVHREPVSFPRPTRSRARSDPTLALLQTPAEFQDSLFKPSLAALGAKIEAIESEKPQPLPVEMVSTTTQTDFSQPEPPALPKYTSTAVQTIARESLPPPTRAPPPVPAALPEIAVHPPSNPPSPPTTRRSANVAPPTRSVSVQTPITAPIGMRSIAIQTDVIRVDRRLAKLPPHLLPSALDEQEKARELAKNKPKAALDSGVTSKEPVTTNLQASNLNMSPLLPPLEEDDDDFDTSNKDARMSASHYKKPLGTQSRPASSGVPDRGLGIDDVMDDLYSSDTEYATRTAVNRPSQGAGRYSKRFEPPAPLPEHEKVAFAPASQPRNRMSVASQSTVRSSTERKRFSRLTSSSDPASEYQSRLGLMNRQGSIRSRSPSMGSVGSSNFSGPRPPFIIPARRSSREQYAKINVQRSGKNSTSPRRSGRTSPEKSSIKSSRKRSPSKFLRKARSSAFIEGVTSNERPPPVPSLTSRSVPQQGESSTATAPAYTSDVHKREIGIPHANGNRLSTLIPTGGASVGSAVQHNVVDAITATTIGEWMFKYMRKRNTFGVAEGGAETGKTSEARHKRWVWLSPYERTVMWSNKQPRTNTALMGKAGRKLPIQSVLDVKDETPPPKEAKAAGLFNRSILILTPDRALKFTAPTKERHYLWLTALSFLAHQSAQSIQNFPKFAFQPPNSPTVDSSFTASSGQSRASSIRNPLRTSRSKAPSQAGSGVATPVVGQQADANTRREPPKMPMPDSAFAPTVPRVPHSRKRSMSATGTMSIRGRSNVSNVANHHALTSHPVTSLNSPTLSAPGGSSMRLPSVSVASSRRGPQQFEDEAIVPPVDFIPHPSNLTQVQTHTQTPKELSPRASGISAMSAEFGGNNNFFDAVGVVRMDAFSKPPPNARPQSRRAARGEDPEHARQESDESFVGPPDIGRSRGPAVARRPNVVGGGAWKDF